MYHIFVPFYGWLTFHFIYPFIHRWDILVISTFWLLSIRLLWTFTRVCTTFSVKFCWIYIYTQDLYIQFLDHMVTNFFRNCRTVFNSSCTILPSHQQEFCTSLAAQVISHLFYSRHPNGWIWSGNSLWFWFFISVMILNIFLVLIGHLWIFYGERSIQILCLFFNLVICLTVKL